MKILEAKIIMPSPTTPEGVRASEELTSELIDEYGGLTKRSAYGFWRDDHGTMHAELATEYVVAVPWSEGGDLEVWNHLRDAALRAGKTAGEQAVYIRMPDGTVELLAVTEAA